jgi:hypothetical protein
MKKSKAAKPMTSHYEAIRRTWGDLEVVDAKENLRVFVKPEDVASAKAKDPGNCVFAKACVRQFDATKVLFWKSVAYVDLPSKSGVRRVERFMVPTDMRRLIEAFDKGKDVTHFAGFELKRPKPSATFAGKLKTNRMSRERCRKALLLGVNTSTKNGRQGEGKLKKPYGAIDIQVRDGTGMVHFAREG